MKMLQHRFVENIPDIIEEGILYISIKYCTAIHKCICGCGNEVVTPLSPTDWELIFDGRTVSLYPSIGNWNFECQSHYWITRSEVIYSGKWDKKDIQKSRNRDKKRKSDFYNSQTKNIEPTVKKQKGGNKTIFEDINIFIVKIYKYYLLIIT